MMSLSDHTTQQLRSRLTSLYEEAEVESCLASLCELLENFTSPETSNWHWSERDTILITYGDQIHSASQSALGTLAKFLSHADLTEVINTIHLLPFCPYSSDDGFSVIDYRAVNPDCGDWEDIRNLSDDYRLMFDFVLNHCSQHSDYFQKFLQGEEPFSRFFIEAAPEADLSQVTRPRSLPLLTAYETNRGTRHVWTTFSADQVDLNFAEPSVLLEMIAILLFYVEQGARVIRLDAIAYLWKEVGTNCIHLPQTHTVVKLMRDVLEAVAPEVLLLTETNVPHEENVSYFGDGDEAHMVYQFSLPPLLVDAFLHEDATPLMSWLHNLEPAAEGTTYFNFTASHDGIGVRPLEGLLDENRKRSLLEKIRHRGGHVSTKRNSDGSDTPYELNITYVDALSNPESEDDPRHVQRFLSSQAVMLALRGIPGLYFHSLVGTPNYQEGVNDTGIPRRINRRKYELTELKNCVAVDKQQQILDGYRHLLQIRTAQPAFHPEAEQKILSLNNPALIAIQRTSMDNSQTILALTNVSETDQQCDLSSLNITVWHDLLNDTGVCDSTVTVPPCETLWLEAK